jgi:FdhE protein
MNHGKWDARIRRAGQLAAAHPFAAEGLRFYEHVAQFQKTFYSEFEAACGTAMAARPPGSLRVELDLFVLLPRFPAFLSLIEKFAPGPLAQSAKDLRGRDSSLWQKILEEYWQAVPDLPAGLSPAEALISWIFLQPYAEYLADHMRREPLHATPPACPLCSSRPLAGVLRPEGDGGKRFLLCALCSTEWEYRRIVCPACGEEDEKKQAVYIAKEIGHVRVEACDTCHFYLKTVDLTKDGHAMPVVDELAAIPLDLWAAERGYTKIHTNLIGV